MNHPDASQKEWVILPMNFGRSRIVTLVGLFGGYSFTWFIAFALRITALFLVGDTSPTLHLLFLSILLFIPELLFLLIWLLLRDSMDHFFELEFRYFADDQIDLDPLSQYTPAGARRIEPIQILRGAFFSGIRSARYFLLFPMILTMLSFWVLSPEEGRRHKEFALVNSLTPKSARSHFFPDPVEEIVEGKGFSPAGKCLAESIVLGQLLGLFLFAVAWYWGFARRQLGRNYAGSETSTKNDNSSSFPFGDIRGGGTV